MQVDAQTAKTHYPDGLAGAYSLEPVEFVTHYVYSLVIDEVRLMLGATFLAVEEGGALAYEFFSDDADIDARAAELTALGVTFKRHAIGGKA